MKKPSEDNLTQENITAEENAAAEENSAAEDSASPQNEMYNASEGVFQQGKKARVKKDEVSIQDEYDDYLLTNNSKKKGSHSGKKVVRKRVYHPSEEDSELRFSSKNRSYVAEDEVTIKDEYNDYLLPDASQGKEKHSGKKAVKKHSGSAAEEVKDYLLPDGSQDKEHHSGKKAVRKRSSSTAEEVKDYLLPGGSQEKEQHSDKKVVKRRAYSSDELSELRFSTEDADRTPVAEDKVKIEDDYNDYLMPDSSGGSGHHHHHHHSSGSGHSHHHHHHHHHHSGSGSSKSSASVSGGAVVSNGSVSNASVSGGAVVSNGSASNAPVSSSAASNRSANSASVSNNAAGNGSVRNASAGNGSVNNTSAGKASASPASSGTISGGTANGSPAKKTLKEQNDAYLVVRSHRTPSKGLSDHHHHHHHSSGSGKSGSSKNGSEVTESVVSPRSSHHHHHHSSGSGHSHHHHHHHHHSSSGSSRSRKKMQKWKKAIIIAVSVLLVLVITVGTTFIILKNIGYGELFDKNVNVLVPDSVNAAIQDDGDYIVYNGNTYKYNKDVTTMLFMGVDKRSLDGMNEQGTGGQADVIVLMALDIKNRKFSMITVPRDTMAEIALYSPEGSYVGMKTAQICLAYAYGDGKETSCDNMVSAVRRIFYNIPIKTYYALDLDGIAAVNDSVGGVDVVSPETIAEFVEGGQYHLEGMQAEHFVRTRDKVNVDAAMKRLERQKVYASSFMGKMINNIKQNPASAVSIFNGAAPYSCTNLNASRVSYLATELAFGGSMSTQIISVPGEVSYDEATKLARYDIDEGGFFEQFLSVYYEKME